MTASTLQLPPAVPGGVRVTPGVGSLTVSWNAAPNANGYKVQWKSGNEGYSTSDRQATVTTGTSHTITGLTAGTTYTVRVISTRSNALDSRASRERFGIPQQQPPGGVRVAPGVESLTVSWNAAANANGYKVQWRSAGQTYDAANRQATVTGTSHTINNLAGGTTYTVRVIATHMNAPDGAASSEATGIPRYPAAAVPGGVRATPGVGSLTVSWNAAANANGYKVQWRSAGQAYDTSDRQATITTGTSHTIPGLTAGATYRVRVISTRANAPDSAASGQVTGIPQYPAASPPGSVTVTPGVESLTVSWNAAANANGYKVQWKSGGEGYDISHRQATVTTGTSHTITGLAAGATYTVRVISTRANAPDSVPSSEATRIPRSPPPGAPGGMRVTSAGLTSLAVSWNAVTGADGYKVQWKSAGQTYDASDRQTTVTGTSHTITGLTTGMEYTVRVIATHTNAPDSAASGEVTGTPRQPPPGGVTVMPGVGSLAISWNAVTGADGYKVQWKSAEQAYDASDRQATATGTSHTITGLTAGATYTVRVISTHMIHPDSAASGEVAGTPRQAAAGVPGGVTVVPGVDSLAVSWNAVTGADGYKVQWKSAGQAYDVPDRQATVTGTSHTITGLTAGTEYTVRIISTRTDAPDSAASGEVAGTPRQAAAGVPGGVTVMPGVGSLTISWNAVTGADGYKVQWKSAGQAYDASDRQATVTGTSHTITGLTAGTTYTVRVIGTRTDAPDGAASGEVTGTPVLPPPPVPPRPGTLIEVGDAAGTTTRVVEGRTVTVVVEEGVPTGINLDLTGLPAPTTPHETLTLTFSPVADPPASRKFNLGPTEARTVVDVSVRVGTVPSAGVRLCLPVSQGLREAAGGQRLLLLHYDGVTWTEVAGSSESGRKICVSGISHFPVFAVGYEDMRPVFPSDFTMTRMVFTVGRDVGRVVLPAATGGNGPLTYTLSPMPPEGLVWTPPGDAATGGTLSGTPAAAAGDAVWTLAARDTDGDTATLTFTIRVADRLRERLGGINAVILPELSRAMTASTVDAVAGRIGRALAPDGGSGTMASAGPVSAFVGMLRADGEAIGKGTWSWRRGLDGRRFALAVPGAGNVPGLGAAAGAGEGTASAPRLTLWGAGDHRSLAGGGGSGVDWDGHLFGAHVGADARFGTGGLAGLAVSMTEGRLDYTDMSALVPGDAVEGEYRSRMTSAHPYLGWAWPGGTHAWASFGYGRGSVTLTDGEAGRQESDGTMRSLAAGGRLRVRSGEGGTGMLGPVAVDLKGEAWGTRLEVDGNGERIGELGVVTRRVRVSAEGSRTFALAGGGALTPSAELGMRLDGGDGRAGAGVELGGGADYTHPASGLGAELAGRVLLAHTGGADEWGVGGALRLEPTSALGLSLRVAPSYGETGQGLPQLWEHGVTGTAPGAPASGGGIPGARLDAEMGYGLPAFAGTLTPYGGLALSGDGTRGYRLGARLLLGPAFELGLEGEQRGSRNGRAEQGLMLRGRTHW